MSEIKVIKKYGYKKARVNHSFRLPRKYFAELEKHLITELHGMPDNHIVYLIESKVDGAPTQRIALYFHDFGVVMGNEEDIVEVS